MRAVIFDFDGTIADSFQAVVEIFESVTKQPRALSAQEIKELRKLSLPAIAEYLRVPIWKTPFLLWRGQRMMSAHLHEIKPFAGMPEVLREIHKQGIQLYIISSNSTRNVRRFLRHHELLECFTAVQGGAGILSKGKALKRFLRVHKIAPSDCVYVGDETRDVEASEQAGIACIAVSWGFSGNTALTKAKPWQLAQKPKDISRLLQ